jgi:[acyl-carrier-protein] S-malonyltransferase
MKQTAVVIAPGRGTYNAAELGYLRRHHAGRPALIAEYDAYRQVRAQETLTALESAAKFSPARHTRGDNASALIHACAYADFLSIDRERYDILALTGNSMGWYIALTCGGALSPMAGFELVNTMGTLMQENLIGGQLIYPFVDDDWQTIPGRRDEIFTTVTAIAAREGHDLALSIELGGMLVLAGNTKALAAFEAEMPRVSDRFPMRLKNHAAFHTALQAPVAAEGRTRLPATMFRQPELPMIDGRGAIWWPKAQTSAALWDYTLSHQVVTPYDFTAAIRVAAREFAPDVFIILGPGTTLGGAVAQSLIAARWRGMENKADFAHEQSKSPMLAAMGLESQRAGVITP